MVIEGQGLSCAKTPAEENDKNKKMGRYPGNYSWNKRKERKLNVGAELTKTPSGVKCRAIFSFEKESDGKMTEQKEESTEQTESS